MGEHEGPRPLGVVERDAVDLGDGLGEQRGRLEEAGGLDAGERERGARADRGDRGGRADRGAAARHGGQVAALEDAR